MIYLSAACLRDNWYVGVARVQTSKDRRTILIRLYILNRTRCDGSETESSNDMHQVSNVIVSESGVRKDISTQNGLCGESMRRCWASPKHFLALTVTSGMSLIERWN